MAESQIKKHLDKLILCVFGIFAIHNQIDLAKLFKMKILLTGFFVFQIMSFYGQELIQMTTNYHNSNYKKTVYHVLKKKQRIKHGEYITLYKDSSLNITGWYNMSNKDSLWKYYNSNGVVMIEGNYKNNVKNGEWKYYREDKTIESVGNFKNDKEDGHWFFYNKVGEKICEGDFKDGIEIENSFKYYNINREIIDSLEVVSDPNNKPICRTTDDLNESFSGTEVAFFRLGPDALKAYINLNLITPYNVRTLGITGSAQAIFVVKPNGKIEIIKFMRSFSDSYDKEIERLLLSMPKWIPATKNGNPVKAIYVLPYSYQQGRK